MGRKNRGYITVEACLVVPLFLFFMLAVSGIFMLLMAEAHIHQSLAEAAGYTAQYCYLEEKISKNSTGKVGNLADTALLVKQFLTYLGDDFYVEKMLVNGKTGVVLTVKTDRKNAKVFIAKASYAVRLKIPLLGEYHTVISNEIKQKAFVGYSREEKSDCYVYITPEQSVYHTRRNCTHLALSIQSRDSSQKENYKPCGFCGKRSNDKGIIYVARTGDVYHFRRECSGLKRTVKRVRLQEVGGLGPCSRCGK